MYIPALEHFDSPYARFVITAEDLLEFVCRALRQNETLPKRAVAKTQFMYIS
jgi:hypothetical protein